MGRISLLSREVEEKQEENRAIDDKFNRKTIMPRQSRIWIPS
jgi:hypothetical protein